MLVPLLPVHKTTKPRRGPHHRRLLRQAQRFAPLRTAVVHPVDALSLCGAIEAARAKLIAPVLVGPEGKIRAAARAASVELTDYPCVWTEHSHAAAAVAAALAAEHKVGALMKGSLHTDEFMGAIVREPRLRTARRMSHVFVIDAPAYPRLLLVSDAAINIYPTVEEKADIVQNAIDLAHVLAIRRPRVAILSAVETVSPRIKSTLDAAVLCKMADRGQITGGVLDGPLAFDNAVSPEAARAKGIRSPVAGRADILIVPDLEAGNMLAKQLEYLAGAQIAGIVLGARVPVILTSRADNTLARLASCAIARLLARQSRH
jgi:phosphate acetyltransferase